MCDVVLVSLATVGARNAPFVQSHVLVLLRAINPLVEAGVAENAVPQERWGERVREASGGHVHVRPAITGASEIAATHLTERILPGHRSAHAAILAPKRHLLGR